MRTPASCLAWLEQMNLNENGLFTLIVECGRHGGVLRKVKPGRYTLGSDPEADVVLSDPGITAGHLEFELTAAGLFGRLTLRPLSGVVSVGSQEFSAGSEVTRSLPVAIRLADVSIGFRASENLNRRRGRIRDGAAVLAGGLLSMALALTSQPDDRVQEDAVVAGKGGLVNGFMDFSPATAPPKLSDGAGLQAFGIQTPVAAAQIDDGPPPKEEEGGLDKRLEKLRHLVERRAGQVNGRLDIIEIDSEVYRLAGYLPKQADLESLIEDIKRELDDLGRIETRVVTVDAATSSLRRRLAKFGIADRIEVSAGGEGTVIAAGEIESGLEPDWSAAQQWFDQRFGRHIVLDGRVSLRRGPPGPPLSIRAVWTGEAPYVIAGNGQKYVEGALLDSGWKIERIERDVIVLSRRGETLRLAL